MTFHEALTNYINLKLGKLDKCFGVLEDSYHNVSISKGDKYITLYYAWMTQKIRISSGEIYNESGKIVDNIYYIAKSKENK